MKCAKARAPAKTEERVPRAETHRLFETANRLITLAAVCKRQPKAGISKRKIWVQIQRRVQLLDGVRVLAAVHVCETERETCPRIVAVARHRGPRPFGGGWQSCREPCCAEAIMNVPEAKPSVEAERTSVSLIEPQRGRQEIDAGRRREKISQRPGHKSKNQNCTGPIDNFSGRTLLY
jgi:hypothetical protein